MNSKTDGLSPELQKITPLLELLPKKVVIKMFHKKWGSMTKCLDNPEKNKDKIQELQTAQTKKIEYKGKKVYEWLEEIIYGQTNNQSKTFIKWYKTEYYKISLKDLGIF